MISGAFRISRSHAPDLSDIVAKRRAGSLIGSLHARAAMATADSEKHCFEPAVESLERNTPLLAAVYFTQINDISNVL